MKFNYYYGSQADQFSFIRIPKSLLVDEKFKVLSIQSKMLYGVLLDRMGLSMKNGWFDSENKVYIIYKISEIQKDLGFSKRKAMDYLRELEQFGLVEKKKRGFGLPSILYIKSFMTVEENVTENCCEVVEQDRGGNCGEGKETSVINKKPRRSAAYTHENVSMEHKGEYKATPKSENPGGREESSVIQEDSGKKDKLYRGECYKSATAGGAEINTSRGAEIDTSRGAKIDTSRGAEIDTTEVQKSIPLINKTKDNKTKCIKSNHIYSYHTRREDTRGEDANLFVDKQEIKKTIGYAALVRNHAEDKEIIDEIVDLIYETLIGEGETMVIASNIYPVMMVKEKFMKLNYDHVAYILECLKNNTTKVNNIRKYMLASLFNADSTIGVYYRAQAQHDLWRE